MKGMPSCSSRIPFDKGRKPSCSSRIDLSCFMIDISLVRGAPWLASFVHLALFRVVGPSCPRAIVPSFFRSLISETQALRLYYRACGWLPTAYCLLPTAYLYLLKTPVKHQAFKLPSNHQTIKLSVLLSVRQSQWGWPDCCSTQTSHRRIPIPWASPSARHS